MNKSARATLAIAAALAAAAPAAGAAGLRGSPLSMALQHRIALEESYTFLATRAQVQAFVDEGRLAPVAANADVALSDVSYPYARPEILLFVDRLGAQYHAVTGERLVVTSLVRPRDEQPSNASTLSVHPTGMAVDLRVPADPAKRGWLERTLLSLEQAGVLDVTRELHPSHYHVAVFPAAYRAYVDARRGSDPAPARSTPVARVTPAEAPVVAPVATLAPARRVRTADVAAGALVLTFAIGIGAMTVAGIRADRRAA
jgi:hypothetical protein